MGCPTRARKRTRSLSRRPTAAAISWFEQRTRRTTWPRRPSARREPDRRIIAAVKRLPSAIFLLVLGACRAREPSAGSASVARAAPPAAPAPVLGFVDETRGATPVEGGILRRRLVGEPATLNAVLQSTLPEQQVLQYLSRPLLDFDARLLLVPGLAERWEVSEDGLEYRFFIRPQAVWEDGSAVTSADAVFTIRRITDPKVPSPVFKPLFENLELVEPLSASSFRARFRDRDA